MKTLGLVLIAVFIASVSFAETVTVKDSHRWHSHTRDITVHDKTVDTNTNTQNGDKVGVGVDVTLWSANSDQSLFNAVEAQYRYDIHNEKHAAYLVAKVNLWAKVRGIFKKGE